MKNLKYLFAFMCFIGILFCVSSVMAKGAFDKLNDPMTKQMDFMAGTHVLDALGNAWSVISFAVNILALTALIYVGVRYMMASAEQRADLKKSMVPFVIGVAITFATSNIIKFIIDVLDDTI